MPRLVLARGNYFGYAGRPVFSRLIYPAPRIDGGLGTHVTLDLAGRMRFGPDVEWIEEENYNVNPERAKSFYASIRRYWPGLPDNSLQPDYAGVRPKLTGPGEPAADFMIEGPAQHGLPGLMHLFGIESPGLTSSLSLADEVVAQLGEELPRRPERGPCGRRPGVVVGHRLDLLARRRRLAPSPRTGGAPIRSTTC